MAHLTRRPWKSSRPIAQASFALQWIPGFENQRSRPQFPHPQTRDQPFRNPRNRALCRLVHPQKHIVTFESLAHIEGRDIGDAEAGIDRQHDEVFHVLSGRASITRAGRSRTAERIIASRRSDISQALTFGFPDSRTTRDEHRDIRDAYPCGLRKFNPLVAPAMGCFKPSHDPVASQPARLCAPPPI